MALTTRPLDLTELADLAGRAEHDLVPGDEVEVRNRFDRRWSSGFSLVTMQRGTCRVRRDSDGVVLPVAFAPGEVRRRRTNP